MNSESNPKLKLLYVRGIISTVDQLGQALDVFLNEFERTRHTYASSTSKPKLPVNLNNSLNLIEWESICILAISKLNIFQIQRLKARIISQNW